jgi:hypothetical protein
MRVYSGTGLVFTKRFRYFFRDSRAYLFVSANQFRAEVVEIENLL